MQPWQRAIAISVLAAFFTSCSPADVNVKSVRERLESGEMVEFDKAGYRRPSCREPKPDVSSYNVPDEERDRVILRSQSVILHRGRNSCFRVGSTITLNSNNGGAGAQVRITKLALVKAQYLKKAHMKGRYFSNDDSFNQYKAQFSKSLQPYHDGVATVVYVTYLRGTATDEKDIIAHDKAEKESDGLIETQTDGETLSKNCAIWSKVVIPSDFQPAALSGELKNWYQFGDFNCLPQGMIAGLASNKDANPVGMVLVKKVRKFRVAHLMPDLNPKYFPGMSAEQYLQIYQRIQTELANMSSKKEWISVTDFEPNNGVGPNMEATP